MEEPTAKLAGKTLALSFKPATKADEDIIAARVPAPNASGQIDPAQLPKSLPGYLINLIAELTLNGQTIAQGPAGAMGSELHEELGLYSPKEGWETSENKPVAGTYEAIGLDLQGANVEQAARLKQHLEQTKSTLESADDVPLATITKHDLVGDLFYATVFNYFALNDFQDQIAAKSAGMLSYRLPSYGTFSSGLVTQYWFGMPRNVSFSGLTMDVDHIKHHRVSKANISQETLAFTQSIGARMSAMEHLVPEQMFSTDTEKAQGISAVKALAIAAQAGQKIWTITPANLELALSRINLGEDTETEIRNAVNAGKLVTAPEAKINFNGWIGEGYTLIDRETGAGAYKIAGGGNGGDIKFISNSLMFATAGLLGLTDGATGLPDNLGSGKPWFSKSLQQKWSGAQLSKVAGYVGLAVSILMVVTDDSLNFNQKMGQIFLNLLGFGLGGYLTGAIVSLVVPAFGFMAAILMAVLVAAALSILVTVIADIYFSSVVSRKENQLC